MRIVIEIDSGELGAGTAHPNAVTITLAKAPSAPGVPQVVPGEVVEQQLAAEDAGPAPVGGLPLGGPAAFIASTVLAAREIEAEPTDAGPAPLGRLPSDEPVSPITITESEADGAGQAPTEELAVDEPLAFIPPAEPDAHGIQAEVADAGPAPIAGLSPDESVAPVSPAFPGVPSAKPPAGDAGPALEALISREVAEAGATPGPVAFVDDASPAAVRMEEASGYAPASQVVPDDLTVINGIGPKISGILVETGITAFSQLAACEVDYLRQLLSDAGVAANADTWPEQASVAATGDLAALEALQAELKKNR